MGLSLHNTKDGKINGIKQTIKIASATLNKCENEQAFVHKMIKLYTVIEKKAKINVLYRFFLKKKYPKMLSTQHFKSIFVIPSFFIYFLRLHNLHIMKQTKSINFYIY